MNTANTTAHAWTDNYANSSNLKTRLSAMDRFLSARGPFGYEALAADALSDARVISVGCGTGKHEVAHIGEAPRAPQSFDLCDTSELLLAEASAALSGVGVDVVTHHCRMEELPVDTPYDVVVAMHMLYHCETPINAVAQLARLTAPQGFAMMTTVVAGHNQPLWDWHVGALVDLGIDADTFRTGDRFNSANAAGMVFEHFDVAHQVARRGVLEFPNADELMAYYQSWPYWKRVREQDRHVAQELLGMVRAEAVSKFGTNVQAVQTGAVTIAASQNPQTLSQVVDFEVEA